jgi:hypothetical protein
LVIGHRRKSSPPPTVVVRLNDDSEWRRLHLEPSCFHMGDWGKVAQVANVCNGSDSGVPVWAETVLFAVGVYSHTLELRSAYVRNRSIAAGTGGKRTFAELRQRRRLPRQRTFYAYKVG